ncbi:MAG: hypothetical protein HON04_04745, partial [Planctomicrobium sp.]|nr:hypothetical protein [Planctomicrobium sp.]
MDKLQPIIKNRFWILAGLVVPLAMYGFFSANSKLKAATTARETELKGVLSNIPGGTNDPNEEYAAGLQKINDVYSKTVEDSTLGIWQKQQERMTWPPVVETYLPRTFQGEFNYRGIVAYQEAYERLMRSLQSRVEPVMPLENPKGALGTPGVLGVTARPNSPQELADVPWKQKVILAASIPQANFGRMRATSEEVWNAQIDIWLLRLLFDAVARLNEDKDSATESILRRIDELQLVGGDGSPVVTGGDSTGTGGGGEDDMYMNEMSSDSGNSGFGGGTTGSATKVQIAFSPDQEFGSAADASSDDSGSSDSESYAMTGMANSNAIQLRYIADEEEKPFLERGFYMSVIIMQDKIPDFLVELANSEWPVRVTRFHVGKNPYYTGAISSESPYGNTFGEDTYSSSSDAMEGFSGRGTPNYESSNLMGGAGATMPGIEGVGSLTNNLPKMATDAMQHPNLVQLDLCGVITMFKQPQSIVDAIANGPGEGNPALDEGAEEMVPEDANAETTEE